MDKYGVLQEDVEGMVKAGQAKDEQEALEKVAAGEKPKKTQKEEKDAAGPKQAPGECK